MLIECDNEHIGLMDDTGAFRCRVCGLGRSEHAFQQIAAWKWDSIWAAGQNLTQWGHGSGVG